MSNTDLKVKVWRGAEQGEFVEYLVPRNSNQTVLDVVTYIQRKLDPTLSYRFACRVGMCGSCAMNVNGKARWTCRTHVEKVTADGRLEIAPLSNLPVIKDLVTNMQEFFDKWAKARGRFSGARTREDDFARVMPDSPQRKNVDAGIECIGCGACIDACDQVMEKVNYPKGLIRYTTERAMLDKETNQSAIKHIFRPRVIFYTTFITLLASAFLFSLATRNPLRVDVMRDIKRLFDPLNLMNPGKLIPLDVKVGDKVLFGKYSGQTVKVQGEELLVMREEDLMGVLE